MNQLHHHALGPGPDSVLPAVEIFFIHHGHLAFPRAQLFKYLPGLRRFVTGHAIVVEELADNAVSVYENLISEKRFDSFLSTLMNKMRHQPSQRSAYTMTRHWLEDAGMAELNGMSSSGATLQKFAFLVDMVDLGGCTLLGPKVLGPFIEKFGGPLFQQTPHLNEVWWRYLDRTGLNHRLRKKCRRCLARALHGTTALSAVPYQPPLIYADDLDDDFDDLRLAPIRTHHKSLRSSPLKAVPLLTMTPYGKKSKQLALMPAAHNHRQCIEHLQQPRYIPDDMTTVYGDADLMENVADLDERVAMLEHHLIGY